MNHPLRPTINDATVQIAATEVFRDTKYLTPQLITDILSVYYSTRTGFELMYELERLGYDVNDEFMLLLAGLNAVIIEQHTRECWEWCENNSIKPKLKPGTVLPNGNIVVDVAHHHPACYSVIEAGQSANHRLILPFEAAEALV